MARGIRQFIPGAVFGTDAAEVEKADALVDYGEQTVSWSDKRGKNCQMPTVEGGHGCHFAPGSDPGEESLFSSDFGVSVFFSSGLGSLCFSPEEEGSEFPADPLASEEEDGEVGEVGEVSPDDGEGV